MAVDERVKDALRIENLSLPSELPIEDVSAEEYVDSTGDDALRVSVLLREDFDEEQISGDAVNKLDLSIRDSLLSKVQEAVLVWVSARSLKENAI